MGKRERERRRIKGVERLALRVVGGIGEEEERGGEGGILADRGKGGGEVPKADAGAAGRRGADRKMSSRTKSGKNSK